MDSHPLIEHLKSLLATGDIPIVLQHLKDLLSGQTAQSQKPSHRPNMINEVILQMAALSHATREHRKGILSNEELQRTLARITSATVELVDQLERTWPLEKAPFAQSPIVLSPEARESLEIVLGPSARLKSLSWLQHGLRCARSVCRVLSPRGIGTGFLIKQNVLVTNNHVIGTQADAAGTTLEFNFEEDISGHLKPIARYQLDSDTFYTSVMLDCTTAAILPSQTAGDLRQWAEVTLERQGAVSIGDHVTIIQHPQGGIKQICLTDNKIINVSDSRLQYTTDTMQGSSGSPVFNDDWRVVAIHHKGGTLVKNYRGDRMFANQGVLIEAVLKDPGFAKAML